ncbi:MAG: hypothetical protein H8E17_12305 [Deltaproteobacteria bacterium]|nr:hypothetical protein [Deltaproteobacteria bacterium]
MDDKDSKDVAKKPVVNAKEFLAQIAEDMRLAANIPKEKHQRKITKKYGEDQISLPPLLSKWDIPLEKDENPADKRIIDLPLRGFSVAIYAKKEKLSLQRKKNLILAFTNECNDVSNLVSHQIQRYENISSQERIDYFNDHLSWREKLIMLVKESVLSGIVDDFKFNEIFFSYCTLFQRNFLLLKLYTERLKRMVEKSKELTCLAKKDDLPIGTPEAEKTPDAGGEQEPKKSAKKKKLEAEIKIIKAFLDDIKKGFFEIDNSEALQLQLKEIDKVFKKLMNEILKCKDQKARRILVKLKHRAEGWMSAIESKKKSIVAAEELGRVLALKKNYTHRKRTPSDVLRAHKIYAEGIEKLLDDPFLGDLETEYKKHRSLVRRHNQINNKEFPDNPELIVPLPMLIESDSDYRKALRNLAESLEKTAEGKKEPKKPTNRSGMTKDGTNKLFPSRNIALQSFDYAINNNSILVRAKYADIYDWLCKDKHTSEKNPYHGVKMPKENTWESYIRQACKAKDTDNELVRKEAEKNWLYKNQQNNIKKHGSERKQQQTKQRPYKS